MCYTVEHEARRDPRPQAERLGGGRRGGGGGDHRDYRPRRAGRAADADDPGGPGGPRRGRPGPARADIARRARAARAAQGRRARRDDRGDALGRAVLILVGAWYLDTSAAAKLVVAEVHSSAFRAWATQDDQRLIASDLTRAELIRAARRRDPRLVEPVIAALDAVDSVALSSRHFRVAAALDPAGLRTLDALHL